MVLVGVQPGWTADLPYVDMDGDGFDDNDADGNGDGIPDCLEPGYIAPLAEEELAGVFATLDLGGGQKVVLEESNAERFGRRQFCVRMIDCTRSIFDADFGSGLGISVSGGGSCAGGVCF